MAIKFMNNGKAELSAGINNSVLSLTVKTGQGDRFPAVSNPDYFYITLIDSSGNKEVVKCTARSAGSDSLTIVRSQEGTSARSFSTDDKVELRLTAGTLTGLINDIAALYAADVTLQGNLDTHKTSSDHDGRYFTETEVNNGFYTKTNIQTSGQASVHAGNLTNKTSISHSQITNDEAAKHRQINDGATGATDLWSASYINGVKANLESAINGKAASVHYHDDRYYTEGEVEARATALAQYYGNYYAVNTTHDDRYYTKAQVDAAIANAVSTHAALTTGVHGLTSGGGDGT
jgi:hypothetical protein